MRPLGGYIAGCFGEVVLHEFLFFVYDLDMAGWDVEIQYKTMRQISFILSKCTVDFCAEPGSFISFISE